MFTTSKKRIVCAAAVSVILLGLIGLDYKAFFNSDQSYGTVLFICAVLLCALFGVILAVKFNFNEKWEKRYAMIYLFAGPFVTLTLVECLGNNFVYDFSPIAFIANYLVYLLLYGVAYALTNRIGVSGIIISSILSIFGLVNHFVLNFRGTPFVPLDFLGAGTAANVAQNYDFTPTCQMILSGLMLACMIALGIKVTYVNRVRRKAARRSVYTLATFAAVMFVFYGTPFLSSLNITANLWNQLSGYKQQGSVVSFWLNTKTLFVNEPDEYSAEKVEEIANKTTNTVESSNASSKGESQQKVKPNIIAIMNETWSDLSAIGNEFEVSEDPMPFYHSLTENTIKGNLFVSIYGNGTSNSEFEFLTGNTLAFLPSGCNAYEQYIREETDSLVSTLANQGYSRTAVHPYYGDGWNRDVVYPLLGFENFYDLNYFSQNNLMRRYVSDSDNYKKIISLFENRDQDKPFFLFNVTMQNHGGYDIQYPNFPETVTLPWDAENQYPKTQQYLSLMKETDNAFKELIEYFSKVEEPTIIVMFGDHQAKIEQEFYEDVLFGGKSISSLSLEENQQRYITPFVIWANYDIEEQYIEQISANYLSTLLLETAGLEMTPYNQYLWSLYQQLPVINAVGYIDKNNTYYDYKTESEYSGMLEDYKILQYNNMFDKEGKKDDVFSLEGTPYGNDTASLFGLPDTTVKTISNLMYSLGA
ncbi:LTA synthase family protein [Massiliimalia timonensis]|uniref:LTA synthase family protein n=1 Tax=Massiliimalia timonensis TaxID=1987501 RepID=A0A8J6PDJ3_9FIRM|nr:LTA synthase family protein [Massiliimalia timonensis]MBC8610501.1 LTA synthase family protein [Massiliimalia timonensis]